MSPLLIPLLGVSIPIIAILANLVFKPWLEHRERRLTVEANALAEKAAQYAAQTERLEQRVRVLERIITDRGVDLSDEIDRLRDKPLN
ncbi:hypothetical protein ASG37_11135 [Sphingomonas sp. Leaf407]|uniref:hypothetical protein n=1 Tax=unclassified Sphingomonas TaxID=196159 RepID=UPI0006F414FF|nr:MULTISPECIES: hypothetical protein [unclassified Sphingomonas]KQN37581.1 hypothetical protein ASE97_08425 [Sphingomonas sp. Leaf42]KQT27948.1 hypothetical protein ASG37_11135 [Sphingomonas sp. Leaf407]